MHEHHQNVEVFWRQGDGIRTVNQGACGNVEHERAEAHGLLVGLALQCEHLCAANSARRIGRVTGRGARKAKTALPRRRFQAWAEYVYSSARARARSF